MNYRQYSNINKSELQDFPVYISNPEIFFGDGDFLLFEDNETFCNIKIEKKLGFSIGSLVGKPFSKNKTLNEKVFFNELILYLKENNICDLLNPTLHFFMCSEAPKNSFVTEIGDLVIDLDKTEAEILKNFSSNYRNEIKKVQKEDWEVKKSEDLEVYYSLYKSIQERQNLYVYPYSYFEKLNKLQNVNSYFWTVSVNNSLEGFATVIQDRNKAYYLLGGATYPTLFPGSNKLLQYQIMLDLKAEGVSNYFLGGYRKGDLEGAKYKGIQSYKKRFGASIEERKLFYVYINPLRGKLYSFLLKNYLKLKGIKGTEKGLSYSYETN